MTAPSATAALPPAAEVSRAVLEAIALRKCVAAIYNRQSIKLAPHILYTRHDAMFVDAVTLERDGQPPRETKLGSFKLDGLKDVALTSRTFDPNPVFDPALDRYEGVTLFAIEPA